MNKDNTKVCIIYPADPVGVIPGGIDTFIRGILGWAPDDISVSLIGVTTDQSARPVGDWTECDLGRRTFNFFAAASLTNPEGRSYIPLSLRFTLGLIRNRPKITADILEFHRIEPSLLYLHDSRPKNAFVHQNMQVLNNPGSDILWSRMPGMYFWLQDKLIRQYSSVYAVREDAVEWYKDRYPLISDRFRFVPTWYDPEIFYPVDFDERGALRREFGFESGSRVLVSVGRLDKQKDPLLLACAFHELLGQYPDAQLIYIGDGVLHEKLESFFEQAGISSRVTLAGLLPAADIARMLRAADLFVLSSAYEGMPMCVLEALGSGLPVVTTDVGEVRRVVIPGVNGEIVTERTCSAIAEAIKRTLDARDSFSGKPCTDAVQNYTPGCVLEPIYQNYRHLAGGSQQA